MKAQIESTNQNWKRQTNQSTKHSDLKTVSQSELKEFGQLALKRSPSKIYGNQPIYKEHWTTDPRSELIADNQTELKTVQSLHKSGAEPEN